jgi:hypothetical protein
MSYALASNATAKRPQNAYRRSLAFAAVPPTWHQLANVDRLRCRHLTEALKRGRETQRLRRVGGDEMRPHGITIGVVVIAVITGTILFVRQATDPATEGGLVRSVGFRVSEARCRCDSSGLHPVRSTTR